MPVSITLPVKVSEAPSPTHRIDDGVKVVGGHPYMVEEAEEERWVYAPEEHHYYFNAITGEIRLFKDTEVPSG